MFPRIRNFAETHFISVTAVLCIVTAFLLFFFLALNNMRKEPPAVRPQPENETVYEPFEETLTGGFVISSETRIIYECHYGDGIVEETEESPPFFMLNGTLGEFGAAFADWEITSLNADRITLRKDIPGNSPQNYVIGVSDGRVAVFYLEITDGTYIKEITDIPVIGLPYEEQLRLEQGISITGDEKLTLAMQNYDS